MVGIIKKVNQRGAGIIAVAAGGPRQYQCHLLPEFSLKQNTGHQLRDERKFGGNAVFQSRRGRVRLEGRADAESRQTGEAA
jgi:hypothetical protein